MKKFFTAIIFLVASTVLFITILNFDEFKIGVLSVAMDMADALIDYGNDPFDLWHVAATINALVMFTAAFVVLPSIIVLSFLSLIETPERAAARRVHDETARMRLREQRRRELLMSARPMRRRQ